MHCILFFKKKLNISGENIMSYNNYDHNTSGTEHEEKKIEEKITDNDQDFCYHVVSNEKKILMSRDKIMRECDETLNSHLIPELSRVVMEFINEDPYDEMLRKMVNSNIFTEECIDTVLHVYEDNTVLGVGETSYWDQDSSGDWGWQMLVLFRVNGELMIQEWCREVSEWDIDNIEIYLSDFAVNISDFRPDIKIENAMKSMIWYGMSGIKAVRAMESLHIQSIPVSDRFPCFRSTLEYGACASPFVTKTVLESGDGKCWFCSGSMVNS